MAVCGKCSISGNSSGMVEMALDWDMPHIVFKSKGVTHTRYVSMFSCVIILMRKHFLQTFLVVEIRWSIGECKEIDIFFCTAQAILGHHIKLFHLHGN